MQASLDNVAALQASLADVAALREQLKEVGDLKGAMVELASLHEPLDHVATLEEPIKQLGAAGTLLNRPYLLVILGLIGLAIWGLVTFLAVHLAITRGAFPIRG
jgi:hypothetical protein